MMKRSFFETLVHLMLGVSWAFILIGLALTYHYFSYYSLLTALFASFVFLFIALFMVLILEFFAHYLKTSKQVEEYLQQKNKTE
jgi:NhaP-type Na+/H+ or K+/H+ antiporter